MRYFYAPGGLCRHCSQCKLWVGVMHLFCSIGQPLHEKSPNFALLDFLCPSLGDCASFYDIPTSWTLLMEALYFKSMTRGSFEFWENRWDAIWISHGDTWEEPYWGRPKILLSQWPSSSTDHQQMIRKKWQTKAMVQQLFFDVVSWHWVTAAPGLP